MFIAAIMIVTPGITINVKSKSASHSDKLKKEVERLIANHHSNLEPLVGPTDDSKITLS